MNDLQASSVGGGAEAITADQRSVVHSFRVIVTLTGRFLRTHHGEGFLCTQALPGEHCKIDFE